MTVSPGSLHYEVKFLEQLRADYTGPGRVL